MFTSGRLIAAGLAVVALAGCGGDDGSDRPAEEVPVARFVFAPDGLRPAVLRLAATTTARLEVVSSDGRPHGLTVQAPGGRVRLLVPPGRTATTTLRGLRRGARYRVVPDGATAPVVLQIR